MGRLGLVLAACLALALAAPPAPARAVNGSSSLPSDRLHFGLSNGPTELSWMTSSGVPWRYRFQYLAGGVDTGHGWATWNSPAGQFATYYVNASTAAPAAYIPVFTYYMLLQSSPRSGSESDRDYQNLNNATLMRSYYGDFKLLMQKVGAYGRPTVVHVEPDLWGYLEQRAGGGSAQSVSASVAASGFGEAAGLPDNVQGFALELLKLRDTYAPNAAMAVHASLWSSGIDIGSNTDASVNASGEADKTSAFLNSAGIAANGYGISSWDYVFNDVDDHNAAWWELASCSNPPCTNQYWTHWWDPRNLQFPNFTRYLAWVAEMRARTGRPQIVWQVPMGNQYFLTLDNSCGHYQDNMAPYFIAHADQLFAAGLIAVMFGAGNSCQTSYDDARGDGVTNGSGAPISDAGGWCSACNTHVSTYADDDGGYIRIFVGQYYAARPAGNAAHVYAYDEFGSVSPAGVAPPLSSSAYWPAADLARGLAVLPDGSGGILLDAYGGLHTLGAVSTSGGSPYWPGWDITRGLALAPWSSDGAVAGWILDGWGGTHPFGGAPSLPGGPYWPGFDIARGLLISPDSSPAQVSGLVLDGYGGLHPFGGAATPTGFAYWGGWDIARGAALLPSSTAGLPAGYSVDGYGGLHAFGGAPAASGGPAYWPGWDIARGLTLWDAAPGGAGAGWTLDGWGGLHEFGGAPVLAATGYWAGHDTARGVAAGGYGSGGRHRA